MLFFRKRKNRPFRLWHLIVLVVMALTAIGYRIYDSLERRALVRIDGRALTVEVADTMPSRLLGLSNRDSLGSSGGMLFVFPDRATHIMVMRDMRFALDMLWLDGNTVVEMAQNLQPEPGRSEAELTKYFSRAPANMVLELPAGFIQNSRLRVGDTIGIDLPEALRVGK